MRHGLKPRPVGMNQPQVPRLARLLGGVRSEQNPRAVRRVVGLGRIQRPRSDSPQSGAVETDGEDGMVVRLISVALERQAAPAWRSGGGEVIERLASTGIGAL
jgi:hypothetical protein